MAQSVKKTAIKLKQKYSRVSKLNEAKMCGEKSALSRFLSIFFSIVTLLLVLFCALFCVGAFLNSTHHTPDMLIGYSKIQLTTQNMSSKRIVLDGVIYDSGFYQDDQVPIHAVDPHSLKTGDVIAFIAYEKSIEESEKRHKTELNVPTNTTPKLTTNFGQMLGFYSSTIYSAAQNGGKITLSHVVKVFEDDNGKLWFQTKGSNSSEVDSGFVSEELILGIYVESSTCGGILNALSFIYSVSGLLLLMLLPVIVIFSIFFKADIKKSRLNSLEQDVVEQKRKLTDKICVKNQIGFRMNEPTKLKVLSQAQKSEEKRYVSLLWRDGHKPKAMKKYVHQNKLKLYPIKKLCKLNNECEELFFAGKDLNLIAKHYANEKQQILEQKKSIKQKLKFAKTIIRAKQQA